MTIKLGCTNPVGLLNAEPFQKHKGSFLLNYTHLLPDFSSLFHFILDYCKPVTSNGFIGKNPKDLSRGIEKAINEVQLNHSSVSDMLLLKPKLH